MTPDELKRDPGTPGEDDEQQETPPAIPADEETGPMAD